MKRIRRFLQRSKSEPVRSIACTTNISNISFLGDYDSTNSLRLVKACTKVRRRPRAALECDDDDAENEYVNGGVSQRPAKLKRSQTSTYGSAETRRVLLSNAIMALQHGIGDGETNRELECLIQEVTDAHLRESTFWDFDAWSLCLYGPQAVLQSQCLEATTIDL